MYDTINFWYDRASIGGGNVFEVLPYLTNVTERQNESGYSASGKIGDYSVNINQAGIFLKGSLSKFFLPSNLYTLTRATTAEAIEKLSDLLHIDITAAKVTRIDVSTILPTKRPPADYYNCLGEKPRFERLQATKNTLYYNTEKRQLIFYDKKAWATAKGAKIPPTIKGGNLLRYELRFTKRLQQQLKTPDYINGKMLYDSAFYYEIIKHWQTEFLTIKTINNNATIMNKVKTPSEAKTALFARLLQQGGQNEINAFLADLKAQKAFADKKYYSRLKADLNKILQASTEQKNDLIKELETAINNVAKYAR